MFDKKLSCELRVVFAAISVVFLLTLLLGDLFAFIGLIGTAFVAATGICVGANVLGPIVCKKSVLDAVDNLKDEVKEAADDVMNKAKDVADDVADKVDDVADKVKDKVVDVKNKNS